MSDQLHTHPSLLVTKSLVHSSKDVARAISDPLAKSQRQLHPLQKQVRNPTTPSYTSGKRQKQDVKAAAEAGDGPADN